MVERVSLRWSGQPITLDTRSAAHEEVDKAERYRQIIECLEECPKMTAKQIAVRMWEKGYIPTDERNFAAPRLTELAKKGVVDTVGKMKCQWTGKTVTLYQLRREEEQIYLFHPDESKQKVPKDINRILWAEMEDMR